MSEWSTEIRWFDGLGLCRCGKPAQGILRGPHNESYGNACIKCAAKAIAQAQKARADWTARMKGMTRP